MANGQSQSGSGFQIINETDSIIRGADEYYGGNKRTSGEAGLDSDSDNETNKFASSSGFTTFNGPKPGKKTRGRVKIEMKFIENKLRRYTTFSKRKTGIMKKAYELSTLTGTQVMLLVASETGHVYTFATRKLQPMITSETGKALIQTCLNSPDGANSPPIHTAADQRMNITGFEETEINYGIEEDRTAVTTDDANTFQMSGVGAKKKGTAPQYTVADNPSNGDINTSEPSSIPKLLADQSISMTTLLGVPKIEKQLDMTMSSLPTSGYLLGAPQAVPANVQNDSGGGTGERASPAPVFKLPSLSQFTTGQSGSPNQPEYTDLKPINISNTQLVQSNQQPQQAVRIAQANQQPIQAPVQQTPLQQAGLAYIPAAVPSQGATSQAGGALVYQTPQGMVYASPGQLAEGGLMLSLPPPVSLAMPSGVQSSEQPPGGSTQYITIPVPVSLSPTGQPQLIQLPIQSQAALQSQVAAAAAQIPQTQKQAQTKGS